MKILHPINTAEW